MRTRMLTGRLSLVALSTTVLLASGCSLVSSERDRKSTRLNSSH